MPKCPFCKQRTNTGKELQDHIAQKHPEEVVSSGSYSYEQRVKNRHKKKTKPIILDGNNIAYYEGDDPKLSFIKNARAMIMKQGYSPIIYISAALRHNIDNPAELNRLINLGWITEVPGGEDDDIHILEEASRKRCQIVSNDKFQEYRDEFNKNSWKISDAIRTFTFEDGKFKLQS